MTHTKTQPIKIELQDELKDIVTSLTLQQRKRADYLTDIGHNPDDFIEVQEHYVGGFTDECYEFEKTIDGNNYKAIYYPNGFNQAKAQFSSNKAGFFKYILTLRKCNPDLAFYDVLMFAISTGMTYNSNLTLENIRYTTEQAFNIPQDEIDVIQTKNVWFLSNGFSLSKAEKAAWRSEIKGHMTRCKVAEYLDEFPNAKISEITSALGIGKTQASKYRAEYKEAIQ